MIVDIQINPARLGWPRFRALALEAEAAGFGAIHVYDHLAGQPLGGQSMIECFSLLGALAEATSTIELGTSVVNVWNREVGTLVSAAASVVHLSGRRFHLGIGAGTSPSSRWAHEQHAVGHDIEPDLERRHDRVRRVLELASATWRPDRADELATFPLPSPVPTTIVGVNSVRLSRLAGRLADGINAPWEHPRRDEFLAAADDEADGRPFVRTVYAPYDAALLDPRHPQRRLMVERRIERLVLADLGASPVLPERV